MKEINTAAPTLKASEIGLIFGPTKTHAARTVSLPASLQTMLRERLDSIGDVDSDPRQLLFTSSAARAVRHSNFYPRTFRPAVAAAGLPHLRFHDLRHTCAEWLIADGAHPLAIKRQLGHEDIRTTLNIYGHLFPSGLETLAAALDAGYRQASE